MIRAVGCSLLAAGDRLPIVIAEAAGDPWRETGIVGCAHGSVELHSKTLVHAADDVYRHRHAHSFRRLRILPGEIFIDQLGSCFCDGLLLALLVLDHHLIALLHGYGVDLESALVQRPQILIDAFLREQALVRGFGWA